MFGGLAMYIEGLFYMKTMNDKMSDEKCPGTKMKFTDKEMLTNKWFTYLVNPLRWVSFSKKTSQ